MTIGDEGPLAHQRDAFAAFVATAEPRLRRALIAAYGVEDGTEASAAAFAYAWEYWDRLSAMKNPTGYLFRVGQTAARKGRRRPLVLPPVDPAELPDIEPGLPAALAALSTQQRLTVLLAHGYGLSHSEVAEVLRVSESSVRNHLRRGMKKLRKRLGVEIDE